MFNGLPKEERDGICSAFGTLLVDLADGVSLADLLPISRSLFKPSLLHISHRSPTDLLPLARVFNGNTE
jgi:hypothetical protein